MIFLICEWAVTDHRKCFQNRGIFVATLFSKLLSLPQAAFPAYSPLLSSGGPQVSVFHRALYLFIDNYNFRSIDGKTNKRHMPTHLHQFPQKKCPWLCSWVRSASSTSFRTTSTSRPLSAGASCVHTPSLWRTHRVCSV